MKKILTTIALMASASLFVCCNKMETNLVEENITHETGVPQTKAYGDKTPIVAAYFETNDVNPLIAKGWTMDGDPFIDVAILFAANIHKTTINGVVQPTLYLNDKLTNVLENGGAATYVEPLQEAGIKVLLGTLGDWQSIGHATMNTTQAYQFAYILSAVVDCYGLDGVDFDDEYSGTSSYTSGSYSNIITNLHSLLASDKLLTAFQYGHYYQISSTAGALLDYAWPNFGYYYSSSYISGVSTSHWAPFSLNLSNTYSSSTVTNWAYNAMNNGYGAMMVFNVSPCNVNCPCSVFQAIADGAYNGSEVTCDTSITNLERTAGSVSGGFTITYAMAQHYFTYGTWE